MRFAICDLQCLLLGSFKEIDAIAFFQGYDRLLPIGPFSISSSQAFDFTQNIACSYLKNLHLEETFDSRLNLNFIRIPVNLESILMVLVFLVGAFFSDQRPSDDVISFFHDVSTPWILSTTGLSRIRCS